MLELEHPRDLLRMELAGEVRRPGGSWGTERAT
jgi:hypothetical protein